MIMVILNAIESIFSIVIMIAIGYILTEKKWFNEDISQVFVKLVINVSLPGLMISDVLSAFDKDKLSHLSRGLIVPFLSMAICYIIAIAVSRLIKVPKERLGLFRSMFFVSNTIFIGITIHSVKLRDIHISMDMIILMLGRFLISPLIVLFLIKIYPIPKMMANVFIIQAAMPVMTNSTIVSKAYNADYEYATIMTVITTLLSLFVIPIYMGILG